MNDNHNNSAEPNGENGNLQFLNDTIPCGFMKYTCEKQPRITYINPNMLKMLRIPKPEEGEIDYRQMYESNIFLMVPMEERRRFSKYLNRVYATEAPIAGEMTVLRCDGTRARVFGWVTKTVNEQGQEEFQSVCMDITEHHQKRTAGERARYLKALTDVYDKVFSFDLDTNTLTCLYAKEGSALKPFLDIAMRIDDAIEKWLVAAVEEKDRDALKSFFNDFCQKRLYQADAKPPQITYRALSSDGSEKEYTGIFIREDESASFFCVRQLPGDHQAQVLKSENDQLKEGMRDLMMQFSDGIAAFEITPDGLVKPMYASENVCEFFGYTRQEWMPLTESYTPIENFVAYSEVAYEDFIELLRNGEAEFSYFDFATESQRRIKAICSQRKTGGTSSRFVMLYDMEDGDDKKEKSLPENRAVFIRTFGYFDVFVGDKPIAFRNKKSKELLALLVDRRGGYVTSEEAIGFLWEDEPSNAMTLSRYRKVALRLKNTLEEYGIPGIVETVDGKRRIVMERVQCDLYNYLSGKEEYAQLFKGSYLTNYSWGETTLGELYRDIEETI
ncbi:MAG: hypothetical protein IJT32_01855 [Lachnospiraceae bacterium]|nr:hypothetical protein [Lachnospiraceae bacterium]